jgi:hypothetical protein
MDPFELRLASVLRAEADRGVSPIDAVALAEGAMGTPLPRDRRRPWSAPAVAALLLGGAVLGGAVLLGGAPDRDEASPPPGPSTLAVALRRVSGPAGDVQVVGLAPSGADRVLVTLRSDDLPTGSAYGTTGTVSERGALAVQVDRSSYALSSIGDPARPPVVIPYGAVISGRWSPTDVLATVAQGPGGWPMQAVTLDGTVRPFGPVDLPGGGPDIIWAADGSGVLARGPDGYGIAPIDGGPLRPGVPALSYGGRPRWIDEGGATLLRCDDPDSPPACTGVYTRGGSASEPVAWLPDPAAVPGRLADASFAADGRGLWLLFDRGTGDDRAAVLVHAPAPGRLTAVATMPIAGTDGPLSFAGFAPDDALIAIGHPGPDGEDRTTLVEPATGRSTWTIERVIGFVVQPMGPEPSRTVPSTEPDAQPVAPSPTTSCAAMDRLLQARPTIHPQGTIPAGAPVRTVGATDILVTTSRADGSVGSMRLDSTGVPLAPDAVADRRFPSTPDFPHDPRSRFLASPDGAAIAVEEGDLGPGGCGDPLVLLADGGALRPFPSSATDLVTDLAWAPDGSALYGVRRRTVGDDGRPFPDDGTGAVPDGPGVVLRWDARTGWVDTLEGSCGVCGPLFVAPDGRHLATVDPEGRVHVHDGAGWRSIAEESGGLVGWADAGSLVLLDGRRMDPDGRTIVDWDAPCCHGTGFDGPLSPDGRLMAGMTLSEDLASWRVTLLDTSDGSTREIWSWRSPRAGDRPPPGGGTGSTGPRPSGYARVMAWAPDGSAVVVVEPRPDSTDATLWIVPIDGSGPTGAVTITVPDLSATLGFPNIGPSVVWLPGRS